MLKFWSLPSLFTVGVALAGCAASAQTANPAENACTVQAAMRTLPAEIRETSGLARGSTAEHLFWTHNDSGNEPILYALARDGTVQGRIRVQGAPFLDWEDIEAGPCGEAHCLYLADIGDNAGQRSEIRIHEVVEPAPNRTEVAVQRTISARYPTGPEDAEAIFRLPNGELYIISKGRQKSITLYRLNPAGSNGVGTLEAIRELAARPRLEVDRVTAASASADGRRVAIRTYRTLFIYQTASLLNGGPPAVTFSLEQLREKQGEAVLLEDDGTVWLTSEAEQQPDQPTLIGLQCTLPETKSETAKE